MEYTTTATESSIVFGARGIQELKQNLNMIVSTPLGSVVLDRGFGIDTSPLDGPMNVMNQARLTECIVSAIQRNEPRVEVVRVEYEEEGRSGRLMPRITFRLKEGVNIE